MFPAWFCAILLSMGIQIAACMSPPPQPPPPSPLPGPTGSWGAPEAVTIQGYAGRTEDPFITSDGKYLLFSDAGGMGGPITVYYAKAIGYKTFAFAGPIQGISGSAASPEVDDSGVFWVQTPQSIQRGRFTDGIVTGLAPISDHSFGGLVPSRDGKYLVVVEPSAVSGGKAHVALRIVNPDGTFTRPANSDAIMANINTVRGLTDFSYGGGMPDGDLEIVWTAPNGQGAGGLLGSDPAQSIWTARRPSVDAPFGPASSINTGPFEGYGLAEGSCLTDHHFYFLKSHDGGTPNVVTTLWVLSR